MAVVKSPMPFLHACTGANLGILFPPPPPQVDKLTPANDSVSYSCRTQHPYHTPTGAGHNNFRIVLSQRIYENTVEGAANRGQQIEGTVNNTPNNPAGSIKYSRACRCPLTYHVALPGRDGSRSGDRLAIKSSSVPPAL